MRYIQLYPRVVESLPTLGDLLPCEKGLQSNGLDLPPFCWGVALFIMGMFIGVNLGIILMCILAMVKREPPPQDPGQYPSPRGGVSDSPDPSDRASLSDDRQAL